MVNNYTPSIKFYGKGFLFAIEYDADRIYLRKNKSIVNIRNLLEGDYKNIRNLLEGDYKNRLYMLNDREINYVCHNINRISPKSGINIKVLGKIKDLELLIMNFDKLTNLAMHKA